MTFPNATHQADHLTHRFVSNGVPLADLENIKSELGDWTAWYAAWERAGDARMRDATDAERAGARLTAAELRLIAALEYHFGKFLFVHDQEVMRAGAAKASGAYRQAVADLPWPGRIIDVPFGGFPLPGVLRAPAGDGPFPTALLVPGLDAAKEELHLFSEVFLRRGMATFVVDGPGQGEAEFDLPLTAAWEDVAAAVLAILVEQPEVDADRIGIAGVSLGGYYAARAAARVPGLRAGVSLGGCYSMAESWPNLAFLSRQAFQVRTRAADLEAALVNAGAFTLAHAPAQTGIPFLVVHGERDRLFDTEQAKRLAGHFGDRAELVLEPEGNHVLHNLGYRVRPAAADWLAARLAR
ncbi:alpha/beta hydrolase family protein [Rhizomonospora bruguierae]|uniref:alpha/beta hydrolase family protein n=1 Tax=Rhizomonospora bruguierae TaxID=1581705 RepID=UPI001BD0DAF8|nr:alpha/beta hydrolase [Micromonospora sp. NBRC 107566]